MASTQYAKYTGLTSSGGVLSIDGITGAVTLAGGNGITVSNAGQTITIASTLTAPLQYQGTWDPTTNTPTLVDGTGAAGYVYYVSAAYSGTVAGLNNPSMTNFQIGDLVLYNGTQWELSSSANGVISVNGQQGVVTVNAINQLTGDATAGPASGSASAALTLATVNSTVGSFGSASSVASLTVNGKGLVTAAASTPIQITESQVTNLVSDLAGKQPTGNYITALTGDVTASGPGSSSATLATVNASPGTYTNASLTVNAKGLVTSASSGTSGVTAVSVASANGFAGTSSGGTTPALTLSTTVTGILYGNGTSVAAAVAGNFPTLNQNTTGTAANITATSNSTLTTLSSLSLPGSQVTGNISGNAANITATSNSTLTTLSALSLPGSQVTGNISGNAANITATSNSTLTTLSALSLPTSQLTGTLQASQFPALTGDVTTTAGSLSTTLATVNSNVGSFTAANITVNAKGLVTAASNGSSPTLSVVSKTSAYTTTSSNNVILCSGSAFTVTLVTATGNTGLVQRIKKTDSSLTNIITIATTSSQTIDGATTTTLNTQYEEIEVVSDGSNWQLLNRTIPSLWVGYTPALGGFGTASGVSCYSRRSGPNLQVRGIFTAGTTIAAQAQISVGFGGTSTNVTVDIGSNPASSIVGTGIVTASSSTLFGYYILMPSANQTYVNVGVQTSTTNGGAAQNGNVLMNSGQVIEFYFEVPIVGWKG